MCLIIALERLFCVVPSPKSREKKAISSFGSLSLVADASSVTINGEKPEFSPMTFKSPTISSSQISVVNISS